MRNALQRTMTLLPSATTVNVNTAPAEVIAALVPGLSLALIDGQALVWAEGFGLADQDLQMRVTPDTAFRAGSLSKLFTASAPAR
ncbi:beta-lactamase/D-alanine carboxypeptidase [compost metagenome]